MRGEGAPAALVIRILLAEVPGLIAALVKDAILEHNDMHIVAEVKSAQELDACARNDGCDVVVTSIENSQLPLHYQRLVGSFPHIPVLAISADGRRADVYDFHVVREVSAPQIVEIIRNVAESRTRSVGH